MPLAQILTGPQNQGDGSIITARSGNQGDMIMSQLHETHYESCYRGNLFTFGISSTALVNENAIATGVTATAKPIIGLWNAAGAKNLVIIDVFINTTVIANSAVPPQGFMWLYSNNNTNITTGSQPINLKTLSATASVAKVFAVSTALTGLTNNLAVLRPSSITSINAAGPATAVEVSDYNGYENVAGAIIVPPLSVVCIMCQAATTTISVAAGIIWEEVPV